MRMRTLLILFAILVCLGAASAWAGSTIELKQSGGTLTPLGGVGDAAKVSVVGAGGTSVGGCTPTAAAPTYVEGTDNALSCDLIGALRILNAYLQFGEDSTNNLFMIGGGNVRITTVVATISTNTTSATNTLFTGKKNVMGQLVCNAGGSTNCGITFVLYGNWQNTTTGGEPVCGVTIPTGTSTTNGICPEFTQNWSYYYVTTTGVAGTSPVLNIYAMQ